MRMTKGCGAPGGARYAAFVLLCVLCAGCGQSPQVPPNVPPVVSVPQPTANDLTVAYIQRLPVMNGVPNSTQPTTEGWPAVGQEVTWRAFVKNFSSSAHSGVQYRWFLDGAEVASGTFNVAANGTETIDLSSAWDFDRHSLE